MVKENLLKGALFSIFAFFFMSVFGAFVKAAQDAPWANFIAFVVGAIILSVFLFKEGFSVFKTDHFILHFCRALFGVSASLAYVYAINYIPLLNATLLYNATPLFIPIFAIFLLKSKTSLTTWIAIFIGFIGVAFIIHPTLDVVRHPGDFLGLGSGILLALAFTFVKMLTKTESYLTILFYFFFLASLFQIPFIPLFGPFPSSYDLLFCCAGGVSLLIGQWGIVKSYSYAPASKVGIFQYSSVISIGIIDWLIWDVKPTLSELIGTMIVIATGVLIVSTAKYNKT